MSTSKPELLGGVQAGDILGGKYRVERILGAGGMGVVVAARHVALDTLVAVKFMLPEAVADQEAVTRFSREARAMVQLTGPHSARVYDVGNLPNGAPYMVMELLVGEDLGDLLDRTTGPIAVADAVDWVLQACIGVAEAHALGIVHRDIKPRNIFLARQKDGTHVVKVLDFGLAKSMTSLGAAERALTRTSAIMGSPSYMSPEQMRALREVDAGTDIWSLGVCLYELLTRVTPFDAPTVPELCALVLTAAPRPPDLYRGDIPWQLTATVLRCLEKDRARRFRDMGELAHALQDFAGSGRYAAARVQHLLDGAQRPRPFVDGAPRASLPSQGAIASDTKAVVGVEVQKPRARAAALVAAISLALVVLGVGLAVGALRGWRAPHGADHARPLATSAEPVPEELPPALTLPPEETPSPVASSKTVSRTVPPSASATIPHLGPARPPPASARPPAAPSPSATVLDAGVQAARPITTAF